MPAPWINDANGDGFMFYPPKDNTIAFDACVHQSNQLVPSIRWELLHEGMEDFEYLWLLTGHDPQIGVVHDADTLAREFIHSRTRFSRVPNDLMETREALAKALAGPVYIQDWLPHWPDEVQIPFFVDLINASPESPSALSPRHPAGTARPAGIPECHRACAAWRSPPRWHCDSPRYRDSPGQGGHC